ncbi:permease-like cell division protein FtsX [Dactylosporangium aurantiacum]|uniref:Permease-like cell division protein FtsX n=1 Tax=Dactylosporangium aurantiacum TaxID=35754 RepID=A0A9Q9MIZ6_9ACTN|nr:permease-like cell division protein FtsX [Dactylosporangium aurantiacum]MDG6109455.1 permease-like cell division protein FtsX [Dactylosporangium aurantiacum]UWZ56410.1 permease-like cell division protein FtsX [Dactylosporangium aurantiacum]
MTEQLREALHSEYELAHDALRPEGVAAVHATATRRRRRRLAAGAAALAVALCGGVLAWRMAPGGEPSQVGALPGCDRPGVDVRVMLVHANTDAQAEGIDQVLRDSPEVYCLTYVPQDKAWAEFRHRFSDAPELVAATRTDSITARFQFRIAEAGESDAVEQRVRGLDGVSDYICSCRSVTPTRR